jgi:hypothetical protein
MAVTNYNSCGTNVDDSSIGTMPWVADDFSTPLSGTESSDNDDVFSGVIVESEGISHYLKCTNFNFTSENVPFGATINGFEIEIRQYRQSAPVVISTNVRLVKAGAIVGSDIGVTADWNTSETAVVYGSSSQLGGVSWTQSDIVSGTFGCAISITLGSSKFSATWDYLIDQVRMRVYYTVNTSMAGVASMTGVASLTM